MEQVTTNQVKEMIDQLAAMTAAASITPEIVASIFEKMRNLNDQEREKVIKVATEYIEEIKTTGITAEKVSLRSGSNAESEISALITEVFPLKVKITSSNAKNYEVGDLVTPTIELEITRRGNDVAESATIGCSDGSAIISDDHKTVTCTQISSGSTTIKIAVEQGGQRISLDDQKYTFMNYRYFGPMNVKPTTQAPIEKLIEAGTFSKELSTATTKASTSLAANAYYVFAVKGNVTLVCHHAGTDAIVTGCTTGTCSVKRVNGTGSDTYSYIIVEKSNSAWSFTIKNS